MILNSNASQDIQYESKQYGQDRLSNSQLRYGDYQSDLTKCLSYPTKSIVLLLIRHNNN